MRATFARRINRRGAALVLALTSAIVLGTVRVASQSAVADLSVDAAQHYQRIDGFGVNANPKNWTSTDLAPAIDQLVDDLHATLWRVDVDGRSDWIDLPAHLAPDYYPTIYETPDFQALWRTLGYLDRKGARTILSASGPVPAWMGGSRIEPTSEDQFVEMLASVVDYGRRVKGLHIELLSPLNETDIGPPEGPLVAPDQYARIVTKVLARLAELGYSDVEIVGPETSRVDKAPGYIEALTASPSLMAHVRRFAAHDYAGSTGGLPGLLERLAYADRALWMTEWSQNATDGWLDNGRQVADEWRFASVMTDDLIAVLNGGASAVLAWDAFDNVHEHCGCRDISRWGLLALDSASGQYSPKVRYATVGHVFKFVPPGWWRVVSSASDASLRHVAFSDGRGLTIVGHNSRGSELRLRGAVPGIAGPLHVYVTTRDLRLAEQPAVNVTAGGFEVALPPDSFFTLSTLPN